jgi:hypothetical protein
VTIGSTAEERKKSHIQQQYDTILQSNNNNQTTICCPYLQRSVQSVSRDGRTRLFAERAIPAGSVIEIARALLLPEDTAMAMDSLLPYLWLRPPSLDTASLSSQCGLQPLQRNISPLAVQYEREESHALLLLGNGAFYQPLSPLAHIHDKSSTYNQTVNVDYAWWCPPSSNNNNNNNNNDHSSFRHNEEEQSPSQSQEQSCCATRMFVRFTARRDIQPGEQLTVDLREEPATGWRYARHDFSSPCM